MPTPYEHFAFREISFGQPRNVPFDVRILFALTEKEVADLPYQLPQHGLSLSGMESENPECLLTIPAILETPDMGAIAGHDFFVKKNLHAIAASTAFVARQFNRDVEIEIRNRTPDDYPVPSESDRTFRVPWQDIPDSDEQMAEVSLQFFKRVWTEVEAAGIGPTAIIYVSTVPARQLIS